MTNGAEDRWINLASQGKTDNLQVCQKAFKLFLRDPFNFRAKTILPHKIAEATFMELNLIRIPATKKNGRT